MEQKQLTIQLESFETERDWDHEGIPVLHARACLPTPVGGQRGRTARRIQRYYTAQCQAFLRRCEAFLLPQAKAAAQTALAASLPFSPVQAELTFQPTYSENHLLSLYTQLREKVGERPAFLCRWGDTWDLESGYPLALSGCFPAGTPWKRRLLADIRTQAEERQRSGISCYWEDVQKCLRRRFNARNFYLTAEGLAVFYPMYAIGPAAEGIPVFILPYADEGPFPRPSSIPAEGQQS